MIHVRVSRDSVDGRIADIHISVTQESVSDFNKLIDRGLNTWVDAPKDLKDLGDMLAHGRITQDHTFQPMNTKQSTDYYLPSETSALMAICEEVGTSKFMDLMQGDRVELNKLLKAKLGQGQQHD